MNMPMKISERRRAEETQHPERDLVGRVIETSPAGIMVVNRQGQITLANARAEQVLGLTKDEITGRTYNAPEWRITGCDGNPFPDEELPFPRVMTTSQPVYDVRHAIEWPDGQRVLLSINGAPLFDESGHVDGVVFTIEDITERKQAEDELRKLNQFLEAVIDSANVWLDVLDEKANVLIWNKAAEMISGYPQEEVVGHGKIWEWLYPDKKYRQEVTDRAAAIIHGSETDEDAETIIRTKSGEDRVISWCSRNLVDDRGVPIGSVALGRDITARRWAEEALAQERNLLRTLIDNLPDYIYFKDAESRFIISNIANARVMGATTPDELVGKTDFDFYPQELAAQYYADEQKVIHSSQPEFNREEPITDAAGNKGWILTTQVPLRDSQGKVVGLVGMSRDITELKRAKEEIQRRNEELAALNEELKTLDTMKDNLLDAVSHELRTPLVPLCIALEVILDGSFGPLTDQQREYLAMGLRSIDHQSRLIDELLDYARLRRGRVVLDRQSLDLTRLAGECVQAACLTAEPRGITIITNFPVRPVRVVADHTRLRQVLTNLLDNAIKFSAPGGRIEMGIGTGEDGMVAVTVSDTGIGIPEEHLDRVFDRLYQVDISRARKHGGLGLGLSIVKEIVELHGGQVGVTSQVGQGSTFTVTLPVGAYMEDSTTRRVNKQKEDEVQ